MQANRKIQQLIAKYIDGEISDDAFVFQLRKLLLDIKERETEIARIRQEVVWARGRVLNTVQRSALQTIVENAGSEFAKMRGKINAGLSRSVLADISEGINKNEITSSVAKQLQISERRARTISNTAIAASDRVSVFEHATDETVFRYVGPPPDRPFCKIHYKREYTFAEIKQMNNGQASPVHLYCGGFNCRHQWVQVFEPASAEPATTVPATVPAPATEPKPQTPKTDLRDISKFLTLPKTGKIVDDCKNAFDVLDALHGDGELPSIPVKSVANKSNYGSFAHKGSNDTVRQKAIEIRINPSGDHKGMTLLHEIGHFLDLDAIGTHGRYSSDDADERKKTGMDAVFSAIEASEAYKALLAKYDSEKYPSRYLKYLLSPRELWARAYSQYIIAESKNARLLKDLSTVRDVADGKMQTQWADDDFEPIRKSIDQMMGGLGWKKPKTNG